MNRESANKKLKKDLILEYDILDVFSESDQLSDLDKNRMAAIRYELDNLLRLEEMKAWQRSRDRFIVEGDRNTSYFHAIANQRRRKKKIEVLEGPSGPVNDTKSMLNIATSFYKDLFAFEEELIFLLVISFGTLLTWLLTMKILSLISRFR